MKTTSWICLISLLFLVNSLLIAGCSQTITQSSSFPRSTTSTIRSPSTQPSSSPTMTTSTVQLPSTQPSSSPTTTTYTEQSPSTQPSSSPTTTTYTEQSPSTQPSSSPETTTPTASDVSGGNPATSTYYVAKDGSDSTGTGSFTNPWATPQKAATEMEAGDTCYIEAGTYSNTIVFDNSAWGKHVAAMIAPFGSGTSNAWETFENYNGGTVILELGAGYQFDETFGIDTNGQSYIQFIGLNVDGANAKWNIECVPSGNPYASSYSGIDSTNINIIDCSATSGQDGGIGDVASSNVLVNGCTINETNLDPVDEQVYFNFGSNITIENCLVENPVGAERCGIDVTDGCSDVTINNNTVCNTGGIGIYIGPNGIPQSNINIYDNLCYNNGNTGYGGAGIGLADEKGTASMTDINIYNNLLYGNARGFRVDQYGSTLYNFTFINNTLYDDGALTEIFIVSTHQYLNHCVIRNNIIFSLSKGSYGIAYNDYANGGITIDHNLFYNPSYAWSSKNIFGTSYLEDNPLLVNPTTDFDLSAGSPAIDSGSPVGAPAADFIGTSRPQGAGIDIGAYEYEEISLNTITTSTATTSTTTATTPAAPRYGRTFYLNPKRDYRLVGLIPRGTALWQKKYDRRTSVERAYSEEKGSHKLADPRVRGLEKIKIHTYLALCAQIIKRIGAAIAEGLIIPEALPFPVRT